MNNSWRMEQGLKLLSEGKIQEADHIFCHILQNNPKDADALYGRSCVFLLAKRADLAIGFVGKALTFQSKSEYYTLLGIALYEKNHVIEAQAAFKSAVIMNPSDAKAFNGLAKIQTFLEDYHQAEKSFKEAIQLQKNEFMYWNDIIDFYWDRNAFETALTIAKQGVEENPGEIDFLYKLFLILQKLNLLIEAKLVLKKIIHLRPDEYTAYANLGTILLQLNQIDEAKLYLEKAMSYQKDNLETQINFALVQMARGYLLEAKKLLQTAFRKAPKDSRIGLNLGTVLYELRQLDQAEQLYRHVLDEAPKHQLSEEDQYKLYYNLSTVCLAKGKFAEGWRLMEYRHLLLNSFVGYESLSIWDGKACDGLLLLRAEQGLGDTIQFIRYLPYLCDKTPIIFEVRQPLVRLIQIMIDRMGLTNQCTVIAKGSSFPVQIKYQVMLMSLPYLLEMNFVPKIKPIMLESKEVISALTPTNIRVGLCWAGNPDYRFDRLRSIPIQTLISLLTIKNIDFHSLQLNCSKSLLDRYNIKPLAEGDLLQTALFMQTLDLIITVDTVIAHLAGLLGKPVWLLNRYGGDWRWYKENQRLNGENLWYPTVKIFQQEQVSDEQNTWTSVIDKVKIALELYASDREKSDS